MNMLSNPTGRGKNEASHQLVPGLPARGESRPLFVGARFRPPTPVALPPEPGRRPKAGAGERLFDESARLLDAGDALDPEPPRDQGCPLGIVSVRAAGAPLRFPFVLPLRLLLLLGPMEVGSTNFARASRAAFVACSALCSIATCCIAAW
uniref:Uncharacterized protein n=1 Tax=Haptolina ericina TaxID=156174 RepID=A0A7S3ETR5_9EUKA|mmetsp:Transcript_22561/g.50978  ORF Transcript_22561/g.50978 Transcript_22561/m.50978 type:complete len:150 (+) Transcript_22561:828-1277(+)